MPPEEVMQVVKAETEEAQEKIKRKLQLKQKISSMGKMNVMLKSLREGSEDILKMKNMSPDGKLPRGILLDRKSAIKFDVKSFNMTKDLDKTNEKRPKNKS
jgi:hypothetical protein